MKNDTLPLVCRENKLLLQVRLVNTKVSFLVDSGANVSVLPHDVAKEAGLLGRVEPFNACLSNPVAEYTPTIHGVLREPLHCSHGVVLRPMLVVMSPAIPILGLETLTFYRGVLTCCRARPSLKLRQLHPPTPLPFLNRATYVSCTIMGQKMSALLDTGSTCCFMSYRQAKELRLKIRRVKSLGASTITGTLPITGCTSGAHITFLGMSVTTSFHVNDVEEKVVIGLNVLLDIKMSLHFDAKTLDSGDITDH